MTLNQTVTNTIMKSTVYQKWSAVIDCHLARNYDCALSSFVIGKEL